MPEACGRPMRRPKLRCTRAVAVTSMMLLGLTAACTNGGDPADATDVVIAASLELTGSGATLGVEYEHALKLEVDQINASGVLGRRHLRLTELDNRTESATALTQVTRFVSDPSVTAVITGSCADCEAAVAKVVADHKVPMITLAPAVQLSAVTDSQKYIFKLGPNSTDDATALAAELVRNGMRTVGVLAPSDAYGRDGRDAMAAAMRKANITITVNGEFGPGDTDLSKAATPVGAARPDAVVVWAFPTQAGMAATALHDAGYKGKVYLDASAAGDLFLEGTAAAEDGANLVFVPTFAIDDVIATTPAKAVRKQWFEDYTARYGVYQGQASFAADAAQLVSDAVIQAGTVDRAAVRTALETTRTEGLSGPLRMTPDNHSGLMPQALTVLVARSGRWRLLG